MQWTGECVEQEEGNQRKSSLSREIVCHKNCSCVGNWNDNNNNTTATTKRQQSAKQVQERERETIYSAHATPTGQSTTKGKRQFIRRLSLSLSFSSSWRSLPLKGKRTKQILAAFWLIANSSRSWLQIKQNVKRGNGVCHELIIFNW